eukprot:357380-Chlamydomonas_euryale.AAC.3
MRSPADHSGAQGCAPPRITLILRAAGSPADHSVPQGCAPPHNTLMLRAARFPPADHSVPQGCAPPHITLMLRALRFPPADQFDPPDARIPSELLQRPARRNAASHCGCAREPAVDQAAAAGVCECGVWGGWAVALVKLLLQACVSVGCGCVGRGAGQAAAAGV